MKTEPDRELEAALRQAARDLAAIECLPQNELVSESAIGLAAEAQRRIFDVLNARKFPGEGGPDAS